MRPNFYVLEYFHHKLANLVAPSTDGTAKCLVHCKVHRVRSLTNTEKEPPNPCIIDDAILPQTGRKLTKKRGFKFGALWWHHLTPQRKTAIQVHNIYILGPKLLRWNFLQISQLSIGSRAHKLFRQFLDFSKFSTAISRNLWRHLATIIRTPSAF